MQTRTIDCVCGGVAVDVEQCKDMQPLPVEETCEETFVNCKWKWSRWTLCSMDCGGGGNTTRISQCICDSHDSPVSDDHCDINLHFGRETVSCNQFSCGEVQAFNKLYWISIDDSLNWPIQNTKFNCSLGYDTEESPLGRTYSEVLTDPYSSTHKHFEWFFLAKEYITAQLNIANGVKFSSEALQVITEAGQVLERCEGFPEDEIPLIFGLKEKLGRLNNNIGGLSNVDSQVAMMVGTTGRDNDNDNDVMKSPRHIMIMAIAVPVAAVVLIALAFGLTIYYVREKTVISIEEFESEDDDATNDGHKPVEMVPLGYQVNFYEPEEVLQ